MLSRASQISKTAPTQLHILATREYKKAKPSLSVLLRASRAEHIYPNSVHHQGPNSISSSCSFNSQLWQFVLWLRPSCHADQKANTWLGPSAKTCLQVYPNLGLPFHTEPDSQMSTQSCQARLFIGFHLCPEFYSQRCSSGPNSLLPSTGVCHLAWLILWVLDEINKVLQSEIEHVFCIK